MLKTCLESMLQQSIEWPVEVNVIDNDHRGSARIIVDSLRKSFQGKDIELNYYVEPNQGLSHVRNRAVKETNGKYLVFIDDDEYASPNWLKSLYDSLKKYDAHGVWGPVLPEFEEGFPEWMKVFFRRKQMKTGISISNLFLNSGNLIICKSILEMRKGPFDLSLSQIGGEDVELFNYLTNNGFRFIWNNEAVVYEFNPRQRSAFSWHIKRAYRGGWSFSMIKSKNLGKLKAFLLVLAWLLPAIIKNFIMAFKLRNVKAVLFAWLKTIIEQTGKIGYFFTIKVRAYKTKT